MARTAVRTGSPGLVERRASRIGLCEGLVRDTAASRFEDREIRGRFTAVHAADPSNGIGFDTEHLQGSKCQESRSITRETGKWYAKGRLAELNTGPVQTVARAPGAVWTHHVVLAAVAFTFLQIERARQPDAPRPTLPVVRGWVREVLGLLYILHNRRLLGMLDSFRRNAPQRR